MRPGLRSNSNMVDQVEELQRQLADLNQQVRDRDEEIADLREQQERSAAPG